MLYSCGHPYPGFACNGTGVLVPVQCPSCQALSAPACPPSVPCLQETAANAKSEEGRPIIIINYNKDSFNKDETDPTARLLYEREAPIEMPQTERRCRRNSSQPIHST
eukprot:TRINITY_DN9506_c0_g1_i14.p1 TRINITY_DN9506_c0_g1~~TRINITY_DN9506_c0_g1_i14.p1  ORF type:complete len:108 (-),score=7.74 TRINITY_DN9506_c0_g1_i14:460-783(-)